MKPNKNMIAGSALLGGILVFAIVGMTNSLASGRYEYGHDDDDRYEHEEREYGRRGQAMNSAQYAQYREECGSCHMAYPPQLLPQESWQAMMGQLDNHFGENAELDAQTNATISQFLQQSSRPAGYGRMMRNMGSQIPERITDLPYFRHEHDEVFARYVRNNDKVTSMSQCNVCHKQAEKGWFDEDSITIPGVGRWDD